MDILVVGAGDMGRWIGEALGDGFGSTQVYFCDTDEEIARSAANELGAETVPADTDREFDIVCIAVPIPAVGSAIELYAPHASGAVFDVSGTMKEPIELLAAHAPDVERASLHPLFAPANEPGNVPVVVDSGGPILDQCIEALQQRENQVFETTAETHDEAMETVQARSHTAILAFAIAAEEVDAKFHTPISESLTELATQVSSGNSRVYADIQAAFDGASDVATAAREIADADSDRFQELYEVAGKSARSESGEQ